MTSPLQDAIVITGAGLVTSLGLDRHATWARLAAGDCGLGPLTALEQPRPDAIGGEAPALPDDFQPDLPREARYLRLAIEQALADAAIGTTLPYLHHRCGIILGTTLHGMRAAGQFFRTGELEHFCDFLAPATLRLASRGRRKLTPTGFAATTCSACSSGLGAIGLARTLLNSGELDLVIAGGYDPISEYAYAGFNSLRLIAAEPPRPFHRDRQGMKLGEGYGVLILERAADARQRGAAPLAALAGFGESSDAHHLTQPHPEGEGAARAMARALESAGLAPADVGLISAHATGTPDNDAGEFAALSRVFGDDLPHIPVAAFKSQLGHTLGGAGAVELILTAMALREQLAPPVAHVTAAELEFPVHLVTGSATPADIRATLSSSLGFGGANTSVVLTPEPCPPVHRAAARRDVFITGVGVVLPGAVGNDAFVQRLRNAPPAEPPTDLPEESYVHLLAARRIRRMSEYVKLTLAATTLACRDAGVTDLAAFAPGCSAILGSTHGSPTYSGDYYREIVEKGIDAANPMLFAEGVPNAAAAHLSLMLGLRGSCQTLVGSRTAGLDALRLASLRIATGEWDRAIVSAAEECTPLIRRAYNEQCATFEGLVAGPGAVTLVLESRDAAESRGAAPRGVVGPSAATMLNNPCLVIRRVRSLSDKLGAVDRFFISGGLSWIYNLEATALRGSAPPITPMYGHLAETFSVMPLAGIAAGLLTLPAGTFGVAANDINGNAACAAVRLCPDRAIPPREPAAPCPPA